MSVDDVNFILLEWHDACEDAERHYLKMLELGATPQIARSVLNNSTKTEIVITANLREWRTILKQRTAKAAHPQIRFVMIPLLAELKNLIPVVFDDITVDDVIAEVK
jgi:thymidylate synthase (FAD)